MAINTTMMMVMAVSVIHTWAGADQRRTIHPLAKHLLRRGGEGVHLITVEVVGEQVCGPASIVQFCKTGFIWPQHGPSRSSTTQYQVVFRRITARPTAQRRRGPRGPDRL